MEVPLGFATSSQLLCVPVDNACADRTSLSLGGSRGPPGKRGAPGLNGADGRPGIVDYSRVNSTIEQVNKIQRKEIEDGFHESFARFTTLVEKLEGQVADLNELMAKHKPNCSVIYNSKCFVIVLAPLSVDQGRVKCKQMGAELANIYSREHYVEIMDRIREMITYHTQMYLGMYYDQDTKRALLRDGTPAPYVNWHLRFPTSTGVPMGVAVDNSNFLSEDMTNFTPPHIAGGAVCEMPVEK